MSLSFWQQVSRKAREDEVSRRFYSTSNERQIMNNQTEYPNTLRHDNRIWEVLGYWWNDSDEIVGYQLRSLDERRELRAIKLSTTCL